MKPLHLQTAETDGGDRRERKTSDRGCEWFHDSLMAHHGAMNKKVHSCWHGGFSFSPGSHIFKTFNFLVPLS